MKFILLFFSGSVLFLSQCAKNPADDVSKAEVSPPQETTTPPTDLSPSAEEKMTYVFTEDSTIGFIGSKVTGSHEGGFNKFTGQLTLQNAHLVGDANKVTIDMHSIWSDNDKLTDHLKTDDFFAVDDYPESTFVATTLTHQEGDQYTLAGELTLHGITKHIAFPATITMGKEEVRLNAEFSINRFDFDIKYAGMADDLIRNEVVIRLNLIATVKQQ